MPRFLILPVCLLFFCLAAVRAGAEDYRVETVKEGLGVVASLTFLPDGALLIAERDGRLFRLSADGAEQDIANVPDVLVRGQGGLHDVVLHPEFSENRLVYLAYAAGERRANGLAIARAVLGETALENVEVLFKATPDKRGGAHFGGRIAFLADGTFLATTGDGFQYREASQDLGSHLGKTVRLNADGTVPEDNPFVGRDGALPEIYSYGHRNPQGLLYDAETKLVFLSEHGPRGGDEINIIKPGANYGWPIATYGIEYSGARTSPYTEYEGTLQPLLHWTPSIAPSGLALYRGDMFPGWRGDLFSGALAGQHVRRVDLDEAGAVVGEEELFTELSARIRDVREAPDGALYLTTDGGEVLRVVAD